ncbi:hypothetical protein FIBSPDRAFT_927726 [Athelia psychrophila]|uniref:Uncharacterized protein n=1 Tax=Athelia psychrophila TaxID=1759441 RepID=A0A166RK18_9AGAM|nr:hypothetical protein FIBSPDRAFT_927726 [Fibularhizoctonia sp. CBS 109695]
MSFSPPIRRLSSGKREEHLIYALEAEEERIVNTLSRKLEQLREEKIELENALEAESESHVNRLSRELTMLRFAQQQQANGNGNGNGSSANGSVSTSPEARPGLQSFMQMANFSMPSSDTMLEAMRRENEQLRNRLVDTERDYIRIARLNEIYREELIDHRRRLGLSVDNLIGLSSMDPYSQPTHRRSWSNANSNPSFSPSPSVVASPIASRFTGAVSIPATHSVPIPRPSSTIHRPTHLPSESNTPLSHSTGSSDSAFPSSPVTSTNPASVLSAMSTNTNITSPPSSASLNSNPPAPYPASMQHTLSYPSVPPPSLSSSLGSPTVMYPINHRDPSASGDPPSRRGSASHRRGSFERGSYRPFNQSQSHSRRESVERGARIAETGTLIPRSRAGSHSLATTTEDPGYDMRFTDRAFRVFYCQCQSHLGFSAKIPDLTFGYTDRHATALSSRYY